MQWEIKIVTNGPPHEIKQTVTCNNLSALAQALTIVGNQHNLDLRRNPNQLREVHLKRLD